MRILLIEDETPIAAVVRKGLERAHYSVDVASDGEEGLRLATENRYGLILLDVMLPKRDGWSVCQTLRARRDPVPIIMLTARDAVPDRVRGLELGADDYLPKPFDFQELLARVRAQFRRDRVYRAGVQQVGDIELDTTARRVTLRGEEVALTPREYDLLEALVAQEGRVLTREYILERVWEGEGGVGPKNVDVYINLLRRKVDSGDAHRLIHTVHGVGYVLRRPSSDDEAEIAAGRSEK
jgi:two-component system copper resistance phosphate regulon response regulator CusR